MASGAIFQESKPYNYRSRLVNEAKDVTYEFRVDSVRLFDCIRRRDSERLQKAVTPHNVNQILNDLSPLMYAAINSGRVVCLQLLLSFGANIWQTDSHGWNAMHYAAEFGNAAAIVTLPVDLVNTKNFLGRTPLMIAAASKNVKAKASVRPLVHARAELEARDDSDMSALDIAHECQNTEVYRLLQKYLKRQEQKELECIVFEEPLGLLVNGDDDDDEFFTSDLQ